MFLYVARICRLSIRYWHSFKLVSLLDIVRIGYYGNNFSMSFFWKRKKINLYSNFYATVQGSRLQFHNFHSFEESLIDKSPEIRQMFGIGSFGNGMQTQAKSMNFIN